MVAAFIALFTTLSLPNQHVPTALMTSAEWLAKFAPTISGLSRLTEFQPKAEIILASQWAFSPIYLAILLMRLCPWSAQAAAGARDKAKDLKSGQRVLLFLWLVFSLCYVASDARLLHMRTMSNGFPVDDPRTVAPILRVIYQSPFALAAYAWFSALFEALLVWTLLFLAFNFEDYFGEKDPRSASKK